MGAGAPLLEELEFELDVLELLLEELELLLDVLLPPLLPSLPPPQADSRNAGRMPSSININRLS